MLLYLLKNPLNYVKFSRRYSPKRAKVILSYSEVLGVLEAMKKYFPHTVYPFIYCLANTGARREEVRLLKWEDIDFGTGMIHIRNTKSGEDRNIRMSDGLISLIQSLPRKSEYLFLNPKGKVLGRYKIDDTLASLQKKHLSMKKWRCHDLRHSFAFNYLKKGGEMYALKAILGHKSIQLTIDLYGNFKACDVRMVNPYDV